MTDNDDFGLSALLANQTEIIDGKRDFVNNWEGSIFMQMPLFNDVKYIEVPKAAVWYALEDVNEARYQLVTLNNILYIEKPV